MLRIFCHLLLILSKSDVVLYHIFLAIFLILEINGEGDEDRDKDTDTQTYRYTDRDTERSTEIQTQSSINADVYPGDTGSVRSKQPRTHL